MEYLIAKIHDDILTDFYWDDQMDKKKKRHKENSV